jgi:hypothetical protein
MASNLEDYLDSLIAQPRDELPQAVTYDHRGRKVHPGGGFLCVGSPMSSEELEQAWGGDQPLADVYFQQVDEFSRPTRKYLTFDGKEMDRTGLDSPPEYDDQRKETK